MCWEYGRVEAGSEDYQQICIPTVHTVYHTKKKCTVGAYTTVTVISLCLFQYFFQSMVPILAKNS